MRRRRWWIGVAIALGLLLVARLAAPTVIEHVVESNLEDMPGGYRATVEGVDLRMLAAEVALLGLKIEKKSGNIPVPYLHASELVVGTMRDSWKPRSTLRIVEPVISFVDGASEAAKQTGPKLDLAELRTKLPFELISVHLERAAVHFRNFQTRPDLDAWVDELDFDWRDLVGCLPPGSSACHSRLSGRGRIMKGGSLVLSGTFERPRAARFSMQAKVRDLKAAQLGPLMRHYAKVDVRGGEVEADLRYLRLGTQHEATIVPRLHDLDVLGGDSKETSMLREVGLAAVAGWFERKEGKKAIRLVSRGGDLDMEIIDLPVD